MTELTIDWNLSPGARRSQRTRAAILDAALDIINKDGMKALSIRRIASDIDYSPAALYEYFKGKDDIINTLCHQVDDRLARYLNEVSPTLPAADRLVETGMNYLRFARENSREYTMLFNPPSASSEQPPHYGAGFLTLLDAVQDFLLSLSGSSREINSPLLNKEAFAYSCWALVHGMASLRTLADTGVKQDMDTVHRMVLVRYIQGAGNVTNNSEESQVQKENS
jgi:AcrR family transcriptional regulator